MYGLKQAAILAYCHLVNLLEPYGYYPCPYTTGLWKHKTKPTVFCLCVDDFGIKYFNDADRDHLLDALRNHFGIGSFFRISSSNDSTEITSSPPFPDVTSVLLLSLL